MKMQKQISMGLGLGLSSSHHFPTPCYIRTSFSTLFPKQNSPFHRYLPLLAVSEMLSKEFILKSALGRNGYFDQRNLKQNKVNHLDCQAVVSKYLGNGAGILSV